MQVTIFYNGSAAGTAEIRSDGLYWDISCKVEAQGLTRLYGIEGWNSQYLGIPGSDGRLHTRMGKNHLPDGITAIVASPNPRGDWQPWRGTVDGVPVEAGYIHPLHEGFFLGLTPEESAKFPEWVEQIEQIQVYGKNMAGLRLDSQGHLPLIERESRGRENEKTDFPDSFDGLPDDLPADDGDGGPGENRGENPDKQAGGPDL